MNFTIEDFLPIVEDAGRAILSLYKKEGEVIRKGDGSPLTEADRISHRILTESLGRLAPELPVFSEEGRTIDYEIRKRWEAYFLIDPVDGTKGFIEENDEFTVNIAMIRNNRPVLGVVHHPVSGTTYFGAADRGCTIARSGLVPSDALSAEPSAGSTDEDEIVTASPLRVLLSRNDFSTVLDETLARLGAHTEQRMHSSLKFCLLAEGSADLYLRMLPCMEWDTAAGSIILEEAGGKVLQRQGEPLAYNRPDLKNPPFFAFSRQFPDKIRNWKQILTESGIRD